MAPILVTGGSGQVGGAVAALALSNGFDVAVPGRAVLDLCDEVSILAALDASDWRAIVNCAAYTAVDHAELEPERAHRVNATAPAILAREAARRRIPLIHVSTDYVFDGSKAGPYVETDAVAPLGVYGRSKCAGEIAIREADPVHAIVRTAWVLSPGPKNFLSTMIALAGDRPFVRVVDDQHGCPTSAADIAEALLAIIDGIGERRGTWHFVNAGAASWHELAAFIFDGLRARSLPIGELKPISTAEYPNRAQRPANSRLDTSKFRDDFAVSPRHWHIAVAAILDQRLGRIGEQQCAE